MAEKKDLIATQTEELITVGAQVNMEEIAAIKVARTEESLLTKQHALRKQLGEEEKTLMKLQEELPKLIDKDTRKSYPEIEKLEDSLKALFGKTVHMTIALSRGEDKVVVSVSNSISCSLTWKGAESKEHQKKIDATQKSIKAIEDQLCEVKKGLGMLPFLERRCKAAVAEAKLSKSAEGSEILKSLDSLTLPGLPAPK